MLIKLFNLALLYIITYQIYDSMKIYDRNLLNFENLDSFNREYKNGFLLMAIKRDSEQYYEGI